MISGSEAEKQLAQATKELMKNGHKVRRPKYCSSYNYSQGYDYLSNYIRNVCGISSIQLPPMDDNGNLKIDKNNTTGVSNQPLLKLEELMQRVDRLDTGEFAVFKLSSRKLGNPTRAELAYNRHMEEKHLVYSVYYFDSDFKPLGDTTLEDLIMEAGVSDHNLMVLRKFDQELIEDAHQEVKGIDEKFASVKQGSKHLYYYGTGNHDLRFIVSRPRWYTITLTFGQSTDIPQVYDNVKEIRDNGIEVKTHGASNISFSFSTFRHIKLFKILVLPLLSEHNWCVTACVYGYTLMEDIMVDKLQTEDKHETEIQRVDEPIRTVE